MGNLKQPTRRARIRALAKINLDLRVLDRRPDGYHELRTIFQTISLSDRLEAPWQTQWTAMRLRTCSPSMR